MDRNFIGDGTTYQWPNLAHVAGDPPRGAVGYKPTLAERGLSGANNNNTNEIATLASPHFKPNHY